MQASPMQMDLVRQIQLGVGPTKDNKRTSKAYTQWVRVSLDWARDRGTNVVTNPSFLDWLTRNPAPIKEAPTEFHSVCITESYIEVSVDEAYYCPHRDSIGFTWICICAHDAPRKHELETWMKNTRGLHIITSDADGFGLVGYGKYKRQKLLDEVSYRDILDVRGIGLLTFDTFRFVPPGMHWLSTPTIPSHLPAQVIETNALDNVDVATDIVELNHGKQNIKFSPYEYVAKGDKVYITYHDTRDRADMEENARDRADMEGKASESKGRIIVDGAFAETSCGRLQSRGHESECRRILEQIERQETAEEEIIELLKGLDAQNNDENKKKYEFAEDDSRHIPGVGFTKIIWALCQASEELFKKLLERKDHLVAKDGGTIAERNMGIGVNRIPWLRYTMEETLNITDKIPVGERNAEYERVQALKGTARASGAIAHKQGNALIKKVAGSSRAVEQEHFRPAVDTDGLEENQLIEMYVKRALEDIGRVAWTRVAMTSQNTLSYLRNTKDGTANDIAHFNREVALLMNIYNAFSFVRVGVSCTQVKGDELPAKLCYLNELCQRLDSIKDFTQMLVVSSKFFQCCMFYLIVADRELNEWIDTAAKEMQNSQDARHRWVALTTLTPFVGYKDGLLSYFSRVMLSNNEELTYYRKLKQELEEQKKNLRESTLLGWCARKLKDPLTMSLGEDVQINYIVEVASAKKDAEESPLVNAGRRIEAYIVWIDNFIKEQHEVLGEKTRIGIFAHICETTSYLKLLPILTKSVALEAQANQPLLIGDIDIREQSGPKDENLVQGTLRLALTLILNQDLSSYTISEIRDVFRKMGETQDVMLESVLFNIVDPSLRYCVYHLFPLDTKRRLWQRPVLKDILVAVVGNRHDLDYAKYITMGDGRSGRLLIQSDDKGVAYLVSSQDGTGQVTQIDMSGVTFATPKVPTDPLYKQSKQASDVVGDFGDAGFIHGSKEKYKAAVSEAVRREKGKTVTMVTLEEWIRAQAELIYNVWAAEPLKFDGWVAEGRVGKEIAPQLFAMTVNVVSTHTNRRVEHCIDVLTLCDDKKDRVATDMHERLCADFGNVEGTSKAQLCTAIHLLDTNYAELRKADILPEKQSTLFELACARIVDASYRVACNAIFLNNHVANRAHPKHMDVERA